MNVAPELKVSHALEISIQKKQEKEKYLFKGILKPKPNQRVFRLNLRTNEVGECKFINESDTIQYEDVLSGKWSARERKILIEEGFDYVIKLNLENAIKYFQKNWPAENILAEECEGNTLFKNQRSVKVFVNKS